MEILHIFKQILNYNKMKKILFLFTFLLVLGMFTTTNATSEPVLNDNIYHLFFIDSDGTHFVVLNDDPCWRYYMENEIGGYDLVECDCC